MLNTQKENLDNLSNPVGILYSYNQLIVYNFILKRAKNASD